MLSNPEAVADLLEGLEVRYLANRDDNLHFALLTDFLDAPQEVMPQDAELVRLTKEGIEQLNQKYENHRPDIFYLFHRPRRWNAQEEVWMGYERKRGKLAEFNAFLRLPLTPDSSLTEARENVRSPKSSATPACCRKSATSSRSTPTRNCRAIRPGKWSGRWPTRSIGPCSTPSAAGSSPATASCSRASA